MKRQRLGLRQSATVCLLFAVSAFYVGPFPAVRASTVVLRDWDTTGTHGWTSDETWINVQHMPNGGVNNSVPLRIAIAQVQGANPPDEWYALAHVPASSLFAGNWTDREIQSDFFAENKESDVQVRWQSPTNSAMWRTVLSPMDSTMPTQTWTSVVAPRLSSYTDWDYGGGSQEQFVNDLASVNWIGVYNSGGASDGHPYPLDDVRLSVPEPAEMVMLGAALVSSFLSLRKKKRKASSA